MRAAVLVVTVVVCLGCPTPGPQVFDRDGSVGCFNCDGSVFGGGAGGSGGNGGPSVRVDAGLLSDGVRVRADGGEVCTNAVRVLAPGECNARTCSDGCCDGNRCIRTCAQSYERCGEVGQACNACPATDNCDQGRCRGPGACDGCKNTDICVRGAINSLCSMPQSGGGCFLTLCELCTASGCATPSVRVGDPCGADLDCAPMGPGAFCRQTTTGGRAYPGGFCTMPCEGTWSACPSSGECVEFPTRFGESARLCVPNCNQRGDAGPGCRAGYECYAGLSWNNIAACWISPPPTTVATAAIGSPCLADQDCGTNRRCIRPIVDGQYNGYVSGYCSSECTVGMACGDGSDVCIGDMVNSPIGPVTVTSCQAHCSFPGLRAECREGYVCQGSAEGAYCAPPCLLRGCRAGQSCNFLTGACESNIVVP